MKTRQPKFKMKRLNGYWTENVIVEKLKSYSLTQFPAVKWFRDNELAGMYLNMRKINPDLNYWSELTGLPLSKETLVVHTRSIRK